MAGPALHEQRDDPLRPGREMRRFGGQRVLGVQRGPDAVAPEQVEQRPGAESSTSAEQHRAPRDRQAVAVRCGPIKIVLHRQRPPRGTLAMTPRPCVPSADYRGDPAPGYWQTWP